MSAPAKVPGLQVMVDGRGLGCIKLNGDAAVIAQPALAAIAQQPARAWLISVPYIEGKDTAFRPLVAGLYAASSRVPLVAVLDGCNAYVDPRRYLVAAACGGIFVDGSWLRIGVPGSRDPAKAVASGDERAQIERYRGLPAGSLHPLAGSWLAAPSACKSGLINGLGSLAVLLRVSELSEITAFKRPASPASAQAASLGELASRRAPASGGNKSSSVVGSPVGASSPKPGVDTGRLRRLGVIR